MNSGHFTVKTHDLLFQITNQMSPHTFPDQSQLFDVR